jgi:Zn-dependent protease with chaperone function
MMHLSLVLLMLTLAAGLRLGWQPRGAYARRWQSALISFLMPALLLLVTAVALIWMGPVGQMVAYWEGWFTYGLGWGLGGAALSWAGWLTLVGRRAVRTVQTYRQVNLQGHTCHLLETPLPYSAQVGFWQPQLVVSQGLLDTLDSAHLQAVLTHESGHCFYRDTFWFFWLGWLRDLTRWLPRTQELWQELMLLREIRADRWAAQRVDPLLLAESLVQVMQQSQRPSTRFSAAFSAINDRVDERIDALLAESQSPVRGNPWVWLWLGWAILPLLLVPFHN